MAAEDHASSPARIIGLEMKPPIPEDGELNHLFVSMRSMGDKYSLEKNYAKYLLNFRKENTPKELLTDEGLLKQDYFQPASVIPTEELVESLTQGIVRFGVRPQFRDKIAGLIPHKYPNQYLDIWIHMCLGVVDLTPYYDYVFESAEEILTERDANLTKAKETNRLWGTFFWNMKYPPVPRKYMDNQGDFTRDEPMESDFICQLRDEFASLGWLEAEFMPEHIKEEKRVKEAARRRALMGLSPENSSKNLASATAPPTKKKAKNKLISNYFKKKAKKKKQR